MNSTDTMSSADSSDEILEEARKKIQLSRLEESELCPIIQVLSLQEEQDDLFLLQLNSDISECLTEGHVLTIRGEAEDSAVLCTTSKTYELREAETSNSLLLLPDLNFPETKSATSDMFVEHKKVTGIFHTYLEMRPIKPSFKKLRALLNKNAYKGKDLEADNQQTYHTISSLLSFVQSSEEELEKELNRIQACTVGGFVRSLDFDFKFDIFSSILNVIESKGFSVDKVPKSVVLKELEEDGVPMEIISQCFSWITRETDTVDDNGEKLYVLDENIVCKLFAEVLLRSVGKFNLQDFLKSWQRSVPDGMTCDLKQLLGMALTDLSSKPEVIYYFSPDNLPENVRERFLTLFKVKQKWCYEEIVPYLEDLVNSPNDVKALLIRNARESRKDGKVMYSPKW